MLAPHANKHYITEQEYLAQEKLTPIRYEYWDGKVYPMPGSSLRHNDIALNIVFALRRPIREHAYEIHFLDVKVRAKPSKAYFYPDIIVARTRNEPLECYLDEPCFIAEVTSKSTEWRDQHQKASAYRKLSSLQTYLIVTPDRPHVTAYFRDQHDAWDVALYTQLEQTIALPYLEAELKLADIYEGIVFAPVSTETAKPG